MNENLINRTRNRLKSEHYFMNDDWLRDCMEYCIQVQENSTDNDILDFVKMQWQLSDLREINNENGSLPQNLSQQKSTILSGNYILQMEQMYDIATSKYKQLEQIRKTQSSEIESTENTENFYNSEPTKKRMIQLKLTDGKQDVIGIEYNYISQLNDMLLPGYKVMLTGPIRCRKGVLLLEEGKFTGIGGEVDNLLVPNALENILARALNLKENADPYNDNERKPEAIEMQQQKLDNKNENPEILFEEDFDIDYGEISKIENENHKEENRENFVCKNEAELFDLECMNEMDNFDTNEEMIVLENVHNIEKQKEKETKIVQKPAILDDDDDHLLDMVDETQFVETSKNVTTFRRYSTENSDFGNNDVIVIDDEEEGFQKDVSEEVKICKENVRNKNEEKIGKCSTSLVTGKRPGNFSPHSSTSNKGRVNRKITDFMTNPSKIRKLDIPMQTQDKPNEPEPKICDFIIRILKERKMNETEYKVIRGKVQTLGKLSKKDLLWNLDATISDGSGKIDVSFSNQVLENLLGFSVQEFSRKRKLKNDLEIEKLRTAFRVAENKLKNLDDLLEIEFSPGNKQTVIKITYLTQQQRGIIDKQLNSFLQKNH